MASKSSKPVEQSFETAIERLEHIVDEMEGDKLPLEQLLELYEEGTKLVNVCQEKLESAEKRIEVITRNSSGKPQLSAFEPDATAPAPTTAAPPTPKAAAPASVSVSDEVSLF